VGNRQAYFGKSSLSAKGFFISIPSTQASLAASLKIKKAPKGAFDNLPKSACGG
jgi:hypothetical protein